MNAYRFSGIASGLIAGIIIAAYTPVTVPILLALLLLAGGAACTTMSWLAARRWIAWPRAVVFLATLLLTFPLGYMRTRQVLEPAHPAALRTHLAQYQAGERLTIRGTLASEPELRGSGQVDLTVRVRKIRLANQPDTDWTHVSGGKILVRVFAARTNRPETHQRLYDLAHPGNYGNAIEITAVHRPAAPPRNPFEFDYPGFLRQSGIETSMRCHVNHVEILEERMGNPLTALALLAKTNLLETFKRTIRAPASRITAAATLGVRRSVERVDYRGHDIGDMFRHAGVGHVLAVSGLHVSVIAVLLFALFRMTGASPRVFVPPLIFFLLLFALLTGARPSSVRAVVMNSVILFTIAYFRCNLRTATTIGLSASAFIILLGNPLLLFAPSFLLSYGAVLSLIALGPPFDRCLCALRGFSAAFFLLWMGCVIWIAGWHFDLLPRAPVLIALGALLWLAIQGGGYLNNRFPSMWNTGFIRIPAILRMFLAAQLAIQIGMMLPLSAWYFGRFPVAGILVNLVAIPIVGILVQLGMLLGLIGLIPFVGQLLALPFGAATTLVGEAFLWIAYSGATHFPFPTTPRPSIPQLALYYLLVAAGLLIEHHRHIILGYLYRASGTQTTSRSWPRTLTRGIPLVLLFLPLVLLQRGRPTADRVDILAASRYPLVTLIGQSQTTLINPGNRSAGERMLFEHLRARGATRIRSIYLPSSDPRAGLEGSLALAAMLPIERMLLTRIPAQGQAFTDLLEDPYVTRMAAENTPWAVNYNTTMENLLQAHHDKGNPRNLDLLDTAGQDWHNAGIRAVSIDTGLSERFLTSARTPILAIQLHGLSWVILTDTTPQALTRALPRIGTCDILVVSDISNRASYFTWLRQAVEHLQPSVLIIGGDATPDWPVPEAEWLTTQAAAGTAIIQTAVDGAVMAHLQRNGTTRLETFLTKRTIPCKPASSP